MITTIQAIFLRSSSVVPSRLNGQSSGLDEGCGLLKVLHVSPELFLQRCSMGPLLCSCFTKEEAEL